MIRGRRLDAVAGPLDQVLYSLSNAIPIIAMSRVLPADDFGRAALAIAAVSTVLVLNRAWTGLHLLVSDPSAYKNAAVGLAGFVGLSASAIGTTVWVALGGPSGVEIALAASGPAILTQDVFRHRLLSVQKHPELIFVETIWIAAEVALIGAAVLLGVSIATAAAASWGLGAFASATLAARLLWSRQDGRVGDIVDWVRSARSTAVPLSADSSLNLLRTQGLLALLTISGGPSLVGSYRLATTIFAPVYTIILGWRNSTVVEIRVKQALPARVLVVPAGGILTGIALALGVPLTVKQALAGSTDADLLWSGVALAASLASVDSLVQAYLLAAGQASWLAKIRLLITTSWLGGWLLWMPSDEAELNLLVLGLAATSSLAWSVLGLRCWQRINGEGEPFPRLDQSRAE